MVRTVRQPQSAATGSATTGSAMQRLYGSSGRLRLGVSYLNSGTGSEANLLLTWGNAGASNGWHPMIE